MTQSGASSSEPFSSPHVQFRCSRRPAPLSSELRFAADLPSLAPRLPRSIRSTRRVPNWSHILVVSCSQGNPTSYIYRQKTCAYTLRQTEACLLRSILHIVYHRVESGAVIEDDVLSHGVHCFSILYSQYETGFAGFAARRDVR
jgi:hypothetical protein